MVNRLRTSAVLWAQGGLGNQLFQLNAALNLTDGNPAGPLVSRSSFGRDRLRDFELQRLLQPSSVLTAREEAALGQPYSWRGKKRRRSLTARVSFRFAGDRPTAGDFNPGTLNVGFFQEPAWLALSTSATRDRLGLVGGHSSSPNADGAFVVHVRRGDYASSPSARATFGYLDRRYYEAAAELLDRSLRDAVYFTDDVDAVRTEFGATRSQIIGPEDIPSPLDTLIGMSRAQALIIPNSTFSWWAAELAAEVPVVAPRTWFFDRDNTLRRPAWLSAPNS